MLFICKIRYAWSYWGTYIMVSTNQLVRGESNIHYGLHEPTGSWGKWTYTMVSTNQLVRGESFSFGTKKLSISIDINIIDQIWEFWLKLTQLIDYGIIDWMWKFGEKLSESIDYIIIDHLKVQGWTWSSCHEAKIQPETQKTRIDSSQRDESICISVLWTHPVEPHPKQ